VLWFNHDAQPPRLEARRIAANGSLGAILSLPASKFFRVKVAPFMCDELEMELAGLEPVTSWVRYGVALGPVSSNLPL
jgi:hypothetical protein